MSIKTVHQLSDETLQDLLEKIMGELEARKGKVATATIVEKYTPVFEAWVSMAYPDKPHLVNLMLKPIHCEFFESLMEAVDQDQEEIKYEDVIARGFKRIYDQDPVWENEYGFPYLIVEKKLSKRVIANWDPATRTVTITVWKKGLGHICRFYPKTLEELDAWIWIGSEDGLQWIWKAIRKGQG